MERFWVYLDNKVQGPVEIPALRKLFGFNLLTQVCAEGQEAWRMADEVIEIKAYFSAPPRGSSLIPDGQPDLLLAKSQIEMPLANDRSSLAPRPSSIGATPGAWNAQGIEPPPHSDIETLDDLPTPVGNVVAVPQSAPGGEALRQSCATCGYKNPRDVAVCMKCGSPLKAGTALEEKPKISLNALMDVPAAGGVAKPEAISPIPSSPEKVTAESPMVEIPVKRIALILLCVSLAGGTFFAVRHMWKAKHRVKVPLHPVVVKTSDEASDSAKADAAAKSRRPKKVPRSKAAALPGVSPESPAPRSTRSDAAPEKASAVSENAAPVAASAREAPRSAPASYTVVSAAYPLQQRTSSPVDSKYAVKRRGDRGLWSSREEQAIQQVQNYRIYGGRRTVRRNADILMQILRDREYTSAYESGKRLFLFNDADWAATQTPEGPVFEVRLTFSGGKEADGSSRAPLRFAFRADLERQTVEPGASGLIKSNTLHAFFDESRIPPEERRSVAQDTGELVQAAQPGGSPLALDTVTKQYAATYSTPALNRVAQAYGLNLVKKKLAYDTPSVSEVIPEVRSTGKAEEKEKTPAGSEKRPKLLPPSTSGEIQYLMERGTGKERMVTARVPSKAVPSKLWEALTSYDRLTQFVPDMLVSQREGQDGAAIIVHTVSLTRLMFFVFKVNLHLRILEHPKQNRLEFERIAGDFEKFSGYIEITPDATGTKSTMDLHLTLTPNGWMPNWALRDMARHFLVPVLDAIRAKAESY